MTYEQAKRIIVTSPYTVYGRGLVEMKLISESQYLNDYNQTTSMYNTVLRKGFETVAVQLATIIENNKAKAV